VRSSGREGLGKVASNRRGMAVNRFQNQGDGCRTNAGEEGTVHSFFFCCFWDEIRTNRTSKPPVPSRRSPWHTPFAELTAPARGRAYGLPGCSAHRVCHLASLPVSLVDESFGGLSICEGCKTAPTVWCRHSLQDHSPNVVPEAPIWTNHTTQPKRRQSAWGKGHRAPRWRLRGLAPR